MPSQCSATPVSIKENWRLFKKARPGRRFQERYWRRQKECRGVVSIGKVLNILCGIILLAVGLVLIPAPGPGCIVVLIGLSMLASEFLSLAVLLDKTEPKVRHVYAGLRRRWRKTSPAARSASLLLAVLCACSTAYMTWRIVF